MWVTSVKSLVYWISTEADEQNIDIVTPASTSVAGGRCLPIRASRHTTSSVPAAPTSAAPPTPATPNAPSIPSRIASTAASDAPDEIPSVNGSASGLRSSACSAQPAPASAAPTTIAASARGMRTHRIA
jgi:hypothetical protein